MMKTGIRLLVPVLMLAVSACSAQRAIVDFDPNENYAALKTWAWIPREAKSVENLKDRNDLIKRRIESSIREDLTTKGYRKVYEQEADFFVAYDTVVDEKADVRTTGGGYVGGYGYPYGGYGYGRYAGYGYGRYGGYGVSIPPSTVVRKYKEGTLIIDLLDPRDKELFWRGHASTKLSKRPTPQDTTTKIRETVAEILQHFPPGS
ncbi:MAG: DUF4136 domain-containing protein [Deltaproteobacteria bacterium]